ncbi:MAG TPA: alpha/beta hydrolase [Segetibacter sp.]|nr:alpha/beta hydrolase [Segetibacter sp.]
MRIFFIPGFGEEGFIFDKIQSNIPGEKVFIDNWTILKEIPEKGLTVLVYAKYLIDYFEIKKEDVVIGHSMGGWIAWNIKHKTGCCIIQIASWTDSSKLVKVPIERHLMYWLAKRGFGFNSLVLNLFVLLYYKNKPSRQIFITIFERLRTGNKEIVAKQLQIIFNPVKELITTSPDFRIHSKSDHIVKFPDQAFYKVPGDHFTLYIYPETVYKPIVEFLKRQGLLTNKLNVNDNIQSKL